MTTSAIPGTPLGIYVRGALGIAVAVALNLGLSGLIAAQVHDTFASRFQLSPSGKRGVVRVESGASYDIEAATAVAATPTPDAGMRVGM